MKLFRKKEEQKKKAQARKLMKLQKSLNEVAVTGLAEVSEDMKHVVDEFEDLLQETLEILPQMDLEIKERQAAGEDTSQLEEQREELFQAIEGMKKALQDVPATPSTA